MRIRYILLCFAPAYCDLLFSFDPLRSHDCFFFFACSNVHRLTPSEVTLQSKQCFRSYIWLVVRSSSFLPSTGVYRSGQPTLFYPNLSSILLCWPRRGHASTRAFTPCDVTSRESIILVLKSNLIMKQISSSLRSYYSKLETCPRQR